MTQPTALERKHASRQALALLTASKGDLPVAALIQAQGDGLPLVTTEVLSLVSGLLAGIDEDNRGVADRWLRYVGQAVEAMAEGEEA